MAKTIEQKVVFKNTTPKVLYDLYMDPDQHSNIAGSPSRFLTKQEATFQRTATTLQVKIFTW